MCSDAQAIAQVLMPKRLIEHEHILSILQACVGQCRCGLQVFDYLIDWMGSPPSTFEGSTLEQVSAKHPQPVELEFEKAMTASR